MEQEPITATELAFMEMEFEKTTRELTHLIPSIDCIHRQRTIYFLFEARRAAYKAAMVKRTLKSFYAEFSINKDTYYDWRFKWYHLLPSNVKKCSNRSLKNRFLAIFFAVPLQRFSQ